MHKTAVFGTQVAHDLCSLSGQFDSAVIQIARHLGGRDLARGIPRLFLDVAPTEYAGKDSHRKPK